MRIFFFASVFFMFSSQCLLAQSADANFGCAPFEIQFTHPGSSTTHYWDFKNGVTSAQANPRNVFTEPGIYEVAYSASSSSPVIGTVTVEIVSKPVLNFAADDSVGCNPRSVTFVNTSAIPSDITIRNYTWVFEDGSSSSQTSPSKFFNTTDPQDIFLELKTEFPSCDATRNFTDAVRFYPRPTATFTTNPSNLTKCEGPLSVLVTNNSIDNSNGQAGATYTWNFGNGETSNLINPDTITYTEDGSYSLSLTIAYVDGCSSSSTRNISIGIPNPTIISEDTICKDTALAYRTNFPGTVAWDFGDGACIEASTSSSGNAFYMTGGLKTITLNVTSFSGACSASVSKEVFVDDSPGCMTGIFPPITLADTLCADSAIGVSTSFSSQIMWDFGSDACTPGSSSSSNTVYYPSGGVKTITLSYTPTDSTCLFESSQDIFLDDSPECLIGEFPTFTLSDDTICPGSTTFFSTSLSGEYLWNFDIDSLFNDQNIPNSTSQSTNVGWEGTGTRNVQLTFSIPGTVCSYHSQKPVFIDDLEITIQTNILDPCPSPLEVIYSIVTNKPDAKFTSETDTIYSIDGQPNPDSISKNVFSFFTNEFAPFSTNTQHITEASVVMVHESTGCTFKQSRMDTVTVPEAGFILSCALSRCVPLQVVFEDNAPEGEADGIISRTIYFGDGKDTTIVGPYSPIGYTYTEPGVYEPYIVIENENGCVDESHFKKFSLGRRFGVDEIGFALSSNNICLGDTVSVIIDDPSDLVESIHLMGGGNNFSQCDPDTIQMRFTELGDHEVSAEVDHSGCITEIKNVGTVTVNGAIAEMYYNSTCDNIHVFDFADQSEGNDTRKWVFSTGTETSDSILTIDFNASGDYDVTLIAENTASGCPADTAKKHIVSREPKAFISLPSTDPLCINVPREFSAFASEGRDTVCYSGYTWLFPDDSLAPYTSGAFGTEFTFNTPGKREVQLVITNINGCTDTASAYFKVYDMEVSGVLSDSDICYPAEVSFTSTSTADTTISSWAWHILGDTLLGDTSLFDTTAIFGSAPDSLNNYVAILSVTDVIGCSESIQFTIDHYTPTSTIQISDSTLCSGDVTTISATDFTDKGSFLNYTWDFGNNSGSAEQEDDVSYIGGGEYTIKLIFEEDATGCTDTTEATLNVQDYPQAGFTTNQDGNDTICAPVAISFTDTSYNPTNFPLTRLWDLGDGRTKTVSSFFESFQKGELNISLTVTTTYGCANTTSESFTALDPEADFTMSTSLICRGEFIQFDTLDFVDVENYTWFFGDGTTAENIPSISHSYDFHPPSGNTFATLSYNGSGGKCPRTETKTIFVERVIAEFDRVNGIDSVWCDENGAYPIENTSLNSNNFIWDFGDGTTSTDANITEHQFPGPGTYTIQLAVSSDSKLCLDTISKLAIVADRPAISVGSDSICDGETATLSVKNPSIYNTYFWSPETDLDTTLGNTVQSNTRSTRAYTVMVTDSFSCTNTATSLAFVVPESNYPSPWDTTIVIGDFANIPVTGSDIYLFNWTPEDSLSCLQCDYPPARPAQDMVYDVIVTDILGCFTNNYSFEVFLHPETFIKLPDAFTPNGDNVNDEVFVEGWGIKKLVKYEIYNRWGELVFVTEDIDKGWDGKKDDILQNSDNYVYKVTATDWRDEDVYAEGYIQLIH